MRSTAEQATPQIPGIPFVSTKQYVDDMGIAYITAYKRFARGMISGFYSSNGQKLYIYKTAENGYTDSLLSDTESRAVQIARDCVDEQDKFIRGYRAGFLSEVIAWGRDSSDPAYRRGQAKGRKDAVSSLGE